MAPFIKGRWGHRGSEKERHTGREGGRERKREKERGEREIQLLHIGLSLFPFSTLFASTLVDSSRKEA